jgi:hypothetical protein
MGCLRQLYREAPQFRGELAIRENMIAEQKALGVTDIRVYELSVTPRIICYYDITPDPLDGKNEQAARYYGVSSIQTIPHE